MNRPVLILLAASILAGCQSGVLKPMPKPSDPGLAETTRNNSYSLLYQLMDEEKDVSLLRLVKHEEPSVKDLIKKIAATSKANAKLLEKLSKEDPSLHLYETHLPDGEVATRIAIAKTKAAKLLKDKGNSFELTLLVSQFEALNYGSHLALVAARFDSQPERAQVLKGIADDLESLNQQLFVLMLSKMTPPSPS
jgi:DNA-binding MarR family transcriptional regulator